MAAVRLLDGIYGQKTDRVDAGLVHGAALFGMTRIVGHFVLLGGFPVKGVMQAGLQLPIQ
jgi:hypothetical protein